MCFSWICTCFDVSYFFYRAACYHLARQYENVAQVKEAIHFFTRAQAYGNAIRICKDNGFDGKSLNTSI